MKRKHLILTTFITILALSMIMVSCKKDDDPTPLTLSTLMADTIDMNAATAPTNVPVNPTITATFSTGVDTSTVTSANITLTQDYDDADIALNIVADGVTITITPVENLGTGTLYELNFGEGLLSSDGLALTALSRSFTTEGTFAPSGVIAHWTFENSADDIVGDFDPDASDVTAITYVASRNTAAGQAASFNGSTSLIEVPDGDDLMNTSDFTLSFWVQTNSTDKTSSHFVMGLAGWFGFQFEIFGDYAGCKLAAQYDLGDGTSASEDLWFAGDGNLGWQGWTYCRDLTGAGGLEFLIKDKWAHIVCVYNSTTKVGSMYINGDIMKSQDFNNWPAGDAKLGIVGLKYNGDPNGNNLAFGFIQGSENRTIADAWADPSDPANNHFQGLLDDVRIFHKAITETEIQLMYNSENP